MKGEESTGDILLHVGRHLSRCPAIFVVLRSYSTLRTVELLVHVSARLFSRLFTQAVLDLLADILPEHLLDILVDDDAPLVREAQSSRVNLL